MVKKLCNSNAENEWETFGNLIELSCEQFEELAQVINKSVHKRLSSKKEEDFDFEDLKGLEEIQTLLNTVAPVWISEVDSKKNSWIN